MNITTFLIVCPLVFLAGFVDAIGGGGGLISLPAYLFAGIPVHTAIGTNKFSAVFGTTLATGRFAKQGMIEKRLALPAVAAAFVGASIGARLSLRMPERMTLIILLCILPFVAFLVLNKNLLRDRSPEEEQITGRTYVTAAASAFLVGIYDGLYGPGTGTFLIVLLNVWSRLGLKSANGQAKAINLATNLSRISDARHRLNSARPERGGLQYDRCLPRRGACAEAGKQGHTPCPLARAGVALCQDYFPTARTVRGVGAEVRLYSARSERRAVWNCF